MENCFLILFLSSFIFSLFSLYSAGLTTLSLSLPAVRPPTNPWQKISHLAAASSTRAHHLKHRNSSSTSVSKVPLSPRSYGGYSISLSFGTPRQTLSFVMDTGSSLVWFPCTRRFTCSSCSSENFTAFIPKLSSSSRIVGCKNPKCRWIFPDVRCSKNCERNSSICAEPCPPYIIQYGSGSTTGILLSETLFLRRKSVANFAVGCSVFSTRQPLGIAGFGRGPASLPAQMGLKKFSYCLVSHRFDESPMSSDLILDGPAAARTNDNKISYTPFRRNPAVSNSAFHDYYYVTLRKITVGGIKVKLPHKFLVADSDGNGGTILDSGTTFTFMENSAFELVAGEFEKQVGKHYNRTANLEIQSGLRPCFNVPEGKPLTLPQLIFHFKGGKKMKLPLGDYFSFLGDSAICLTIVTSNGGAGVGQGPAIILGNYQQQNMYMEYDLEKERVGFRKQSCK